MINLATIKQQFPIFLAHPQWVYLDSGVSTQKPAVVIEALTRFYSDHYANIHRGVYTQSQEATELFDGVRAKLASFIGAPSSSTMQFVRGTTEGINLVAYGLETIVKPNQTIVVSEMEHHSNFLPWLRLSQKTGAALKVISITDSGELNNDDIEVYINESTAVVALTHVSNVLGTINPIQSIIEKAKKVGAFTLIDAAQSVAHTPVNITQLGCDAFVFSAHKMYGPTGIGALFLTPEWQQKLPPYQLGGGMIDSVTLSSATWTKAPYKFEAGTPAIAEAIGFGAAIDWILDQSIEAIAQHEHSLLTYATEQIKAQFPSIKIIGESPQKAGVISFVWDITHPHDLGTVLDSLNIAIRAGHHCAQPLMRRFKVPATARASFGVYNTPDDVNALLEGLKKVEEIFA